MDARNSCYRGGQAGACLSCYEAFLIDLKAPRAPVTTRDELRTSSPPILSRANDTRHDSSAAHRLGLKIIQLYDDDITTSRYILLFRDRLLPASPVRGRAEDCRVSDRGVGQHIFDD